MTGRNRRADNARPRGRVVALAATLACALVAPVATNTTRADASGPAVRSATASAPATAPSRKHHTPRRPTRASLARTAPLQLTYHGGSARAGYGGPIGVTTGKPRVYLVFWGAQWGAASLDANGNVTFANDPFDAAPTLQQLFRGIGTGGETWSGLHTIYCDGVGVGATTCPATAQHVGYPTGGALAGVWYDGASALPASINDHALAAEAVAASTHFGNLTPATNRNAQYFIVSPPGTNPGGWTDPAQNFCAWHDDTGDPFLIGGPVSSPNGAVAFTNFPYVAEAGGSCGAGMVNSPGELDGVTMTAGHEYAETITDQFFSNTDGGWSDSNGDENADRCAYLGTGPGAARNITFTTGSFALQGSWSNETKSCQMTRAVVSSPPAARTVVVHWNATESARINQMAPTLGVAPAAVQKTAVYVVSFLLGFAPATTEPTTLPLPGAAVTYADTWSTAELSVLDRVVAKFATSDTGATRISVGIIDFLLALGGR